MIVIIHCNKNNKIADYLTLKKKNREKKKRESKGKHLEVLHEEIPAPNSVLKNWSSE